MISTNSGEAAGLLLNMYPLEHYIPLKLLVGSDDSFPLKKKCSQDPGDLFPIFRLQRHQGDLPFVFQMMPHPDPPNQPTPPQ